MWLIELLRELLSALFSELSLPGSVPRPPLAARAGASAGLRAAGVNTG